MTEHLKENAENKNMKSNEDFVNDIPTSMYDFVGNKGYSYTKLSDKYNDIISSSATMLFVGLVGIILLLLTTNHVIPIPLNPETSWLFLTVLGGIFTIFIIAGIVSFMHAKQVKIDAKEEDQLISSIWEWSNQNLSISVLNKDLDLTQPEEILYFSRADRIKDSLMHQFENADEALIYEMTEQIYQKLFETSLED